MVKENVAEVVAVLPDDLIMEILVRLPVKILKRFSCVCKSWYDIIKDPVFIAQHLYRSRLFDREREKWLIRDLEASSFFLMETTTSTSVPIPVPDPGVRTRIHVPGFEQCTSEFFGACDGILCLYSYSVGVLLWNPATREIKSLPMTTWREWLYEEGTVLRLAFGYDPKTDDYKIVKFVTTPIQEVELYTLRSDSWRPIEYFPVTKFDTINLTSDFNACLKGRHHWWGFYSGENRDNLILYFDMSDEVFGTIAIPDSFLELRGEIALYNGMIALILYRKEFYFSIGGPIDVWVMKEYGVKESWTLLSTTVGVQMAIVEIWSSHDHGIFMESVSTPPELLFYQPSSTDQQYFKNLGFISTLGQLIMYQETLVSLNGTHEEEAGIIRPMISQSF